MLQLEAQRQAHELRVAEIEAAARKSSEKIQADSLEIAKATQATMAGLRDVAEQTKAIHETSREDSTRVDQFMKRWTAVAVLVGVVGLIVVVFTYFFPDFGREVTDNIGAWLRGQ